MARFCRWPVGTLFAFMVLAVASPRGEGAVDDTEVRWRREYPQAAKTLESAASQFQAVGSVRQRWLNGSIFLVENLVLGRSEDRVVYCFDGITDQDRTGKKTRKPAGVTCVTREYEFYLRRPTEGSPYVLERYEGESGGDELVKDNIARYTRSATQYLGQSLSQRMRSPTFRLLAAEEVDADDGSAGRWVRLRYQYEEEFRSEDGSIRLEPARSWAIRRVDLESRSKKGAQDKVVFKFAVNYPEEEAIRLIPNDVDDLTETSKPDVYQQFHVTLTKIEPGPPPDSMFRLSGYGLPDVPLRPVPAHRAFSWRSPLLWGSITVAVVAVFALRWLRRRDDRGILASR